MDKVDGAGNFLFRPDVPVPRKKTDKKDKTRSASFGGVIGELFNADASSASAAADIQSDEELERIVDSIHRFGEELMKFPGPDNLARYKQAVRDFVSHIVDNAYAAEEQTSRRNILNQKKYTILTVVDERLDKLSRSVLSGQAEQITMLAKIEEIQGLLVDLVHVS